MPHPEYIPVRDVSVGGAAVMESSALLRISASIKASRPLIWADTGYRFESMKLTILGELGSEVVFPVPRTDLQGWKDPRSNQFVDVSAEGAYSHRYTVEVELCDANGVGLGLPSYTIGPFVVPEGDGAIDLDKLVPVGTVSGDSVSIPDSWSAAVAAAEAAALAAEAALVDSATFVGSEIARPGSPANNEVTAKVNALVALGVPLAVAEALASDPTIAAGGIAAAQAAAPAAVAAEVENGALSIAYHRGRFPVFQIDTGGVAITSKETYVDATYTITDTDGGLLHSGAVKVRGRGNSTWLLPKKPLRLNFNVATAPLGMTAVQKNWALLANHFDAAKVNNAFALELGARMDGLAWTPQYRTVELVLNGAFLGLYQLADLVRMETGRVAGAVPTGAGDGSDGTWLMEISNKERPGGGAPTGDPGFASSIYDVWTFYDTPEAPTPSQVAYIAAAVTALETKLRDGDWAGWKERADATSFADWWLINELVHNQDSAFYSSCKIQKRPDAGAVPGKFVMGPLWDQDLSLSLAWGDLTQAADASPTEWWTRRAPWIARMWQDASWRALVQSRWAALLAAIDDMGGPNEWIDRSVDRNTEAIRRDNQKWGQSTYTALEADKRKRWLVTRIAWMSAQIAAPIDPVPTTVTANV